jgi:hypothetical protein
VVSRRVTSNVASSRSLPASDMAAGNHHEFKDLCMQLAGVDGSHPVAAR